MRLIDAEPVKNFIVDGLNNKEPNKAFGHDAIEILAEIEYAPTIEATPVVHGYWREYTRCALVNWKNGNPVWVDRAVYYCDGCSFGTIIKHNYCPRCGQKMDGGVSDG